MAGVTTRLVCQGSKEPVSRHMTVGTGSRARALGASPPRMESWTVRAVAPSLRTETDVERMLVEKLTPLAGVTYRAPLQSEARAASMTRTPPSETVVAL